jgi:hypothetical protein
MLHNVATHILICSEIKMMWYQFYNPHPLIIKKMKQTWNKGSLQHNTWTKYDIPFLHCSHRFKLRGIWFSCLYFQQHEHMWLASQPHLNKCALFTQKWTKKKAPIRPSKKSKCCIKTPKEAELLLVGKKNFRQGEMSFVLWGISITIKS